MKIIQNCIIRSSLVILFIVGRAKCSTVFSALMLAVAMLFFAGNAYAQIGWTDTTGAGTAVVVRPNN
jgi:hypothetical protein